MSEQGELIGPEIIRMTNRLSSPGQGQRQPHTVRGQLCAMATCESEQQQQSMNPAPPLSSLSFFSLLPLSFF